MLKNPFIFSTFYWDNYTCLVLVFWLFRFTGFFLFLLSSWLKIHYLVTGHTLFFFFLVIVRMPSHSVTHLHFNNMIIKKQHKSFWLSASCLPTTHLLSVEIMEVSILRSFNVIELFDVLENQKHIQACNIESKCKETWPLTTFLIP